MLYLLTEGDYSDYGVEALVQADHEITETMLENALRAYRRAYDVAMRNSQAAMVVRFGGSARDSEVTWTESMREFWEEECQSWPPKDVFLAKHLGATLVKYEEVRA